MWETDPIVLQLIKYMEEKGCSVRLPKFHHSKNGVYFNYKEEEVFVDGEDIYVALHAAYRIEWEPSRIAKRFERYLIDLHNKRRTKDERSMDSIIDTQ